ncbi:hypothetical protein DPMN_008626 [Dreissena polymorpha]|uniref:Uncharacterized protein n=1 Tax=Dreissena polymorpha TaxID=45954 RepID=A0A9D4RZV2_DREPO|nr:hypothetical protein DPMN_008626 [Dreissena polymorpha]
MQKHLQPHVSSTIIDFNEEVDYGRANFGNVDDSYDASTVTNAFHSASLRLKSTQTFL